MDQMDDNRIPMNNAHLRGLYSALRHPKAMSFRSNVHPRKTVATTLVSCSQTQAHAHVRGNASCIQTSLGKGSARSPRSILKTSRNAP